MVIARSQRLTGVTEFFQEIEKTKDARQFVYTHLPSDIKDIAQLSAEDRKKTEEVVDFLNELGALVEFGLVPKRIVFSMCHSMIIRCWYKLRGYAKCREKELGGRYARRVERLEKRAKVYHDLNPLHNKTIIKLPRPGEGRSILIYRTMNRYGWKGVLEQIVRKTRWFFQIY